MSKKDAEFFARFKKAPAMTDRPAEWRIHTSSLLTQVLDNPGTAVLAQPLRIFGQLLAEVAERAIELDDPKLNLLMLRLTLYDQADPGKHKHREIDELFASQHKRIAEEFDDG